MKQIKLNFLIGQILGFTGEPLEILEKVERLRWN
jgi:hypothetical protein